MHKTSLVFKDHLPHVGLDSREPLGRKVLLALSVRQTHDQLSELNAPDASRLKRLGKNTGWVLLIGEIRNGSRIERQLVLALDKVGIYDVSALCEDLLHAKGEVVVESLRGRVVLGHTVNDAAIRFEVRKLTNFKLDSAILREQILCARREIPVDLTDVELSTAYLCRDPVQIALRLSVENAEDPELEPAFRRCQIEVVSVRKPLLFVFKPPSISGQFGLKFNLAGIWWLLDGGFDALCGLILLRGEERGVRADAVALLGDLNFLLGTPHQQRLMEVGAASSADFVSR